MKLHSLLALTLLLAGVLTIGRCQDGAEEDYMMVDDEEDYEIGDDMMGQMGGMGEEEEEVEEPAPKEVRPPKYFTAPELVEGTTNLAEVFLNAGSLGSKWIVSNAKKDDVDEELAKYDGKWAVEEPENQPLIGDLGLVLKSKAKHHAISASLDRPFVFEDEPFIVQYEVKYQNGMECGGSYVKLLTDNKDLKLAGFHDKTPYTIMFGPDKCGNDNKLHFIFRHKNPVTGEFEEKHAKKPTGTFSQVFGDKKTHLFTLILEPDNSFEILVDQKSISSGNLLEDMTPAVNPPAEIDDPNETKPADWDDKKKIADPEAEKPEDWDEDAPAKIDDPDAEKPDDWLDSEPELIDDPDAEKPEDWDDDMDGEWEPPKIKNPKCDDVGCGEWETPTISNPDYKGKWKAAMIDNPNYKGEWKPQRIANPGFFEDLEPFRMTTIAAVGLELWSMTESILFDNFLITNSREVADKFAADTWAPKTEEEGYTASADSVVGSLLGATDERPWLWAIYALVILIPIFLCFRFCFPKGSSSDAEHPKKTDAPSADDEAKEGEEEEGEEEAAGTEEAGAEGGEEEETVRQRGKKKTKADLEQSSAAAKAEEPSAEEEKTTASGDSPSRKSPRQRKSRKE